MKLYINTTLTEDIPSGIIEDVGRYSITPTSFESRKFMVSAEELSFIDTYSHEPTSSIALRFGISAKAGLSALETYPVAFVVPSVSLSGAAVASPSAGADGSSRGTSAASSKIQEMANSVRHTDIELTVLTEAIDHLFSSEEIRTVLVDILVREQKTNGAIIKDSTALLTYLKSIR